MEQRITLTEDQCIGKGLDFNTELNKLQADGYVIMNGYTHPAVGKVSVLVKQVSEYTPKPDNKLIFMLAEINEACPVEDVAMMLHSELDANVIVTTFDAEAFKQFMQDPIRDDLNLTEFCRISGQTIVDTDVLPLRGTQYADNSIEDNDADQEDRLNHYMRTPDGYDHSEP